MTCVYFRHVDIFHNLNISNHVRITGVNIVKLEDRERHLTVGSSLNKHLFWEALDCHLYPTATPVQTYKM